MLQEKIEILKQIFPDFFVRKGEEFVCYCPKHTHHKKKLEINLNKNNFACWVCKWGGSVFKLLRDCGNKTQINQYYTLVGYEPKIEDGATEKLSLPPEYRFLRNCDESEEVENAISYLREHGIRNEEIITGKIGFCLTGEYANRIIFPSFDDAGNLNFFNSRTMDANDPYKYRASGRHSRIVFNELFVDWSKPVVLVESVKTYCRHFRRVPNIICLNGSFISKNYELFKKIIINDCPLVYVGFDPEAEPESLATIKKFADYNIPVKMINFSKQPDELETNEFIKSIELAQELDKFDLLKQKLRKLYE